MPYFINRGGALEWKQVPKPPDDTFVEHPVAPPEAPELQPDINPLDDDDSGLPSRSALLAMSKDDLEAFAIEHDVDPEGATKQQIVDTLYGD